MVKKPNKYKDTPHSLMLWANRVSSVFWHNNIYAPLFHNGLMEAYTINLQNKTTDMLVDQLSFESTVIKLGKQVERYPKKYLDSYSKVSSKIFEISSKLSGSVGKIDDRALLVLFNKYLEAFLEFEPYLNFPHYLSYYLEKGISEKYGDDFYIITALTKPLIINQIYSDLISLKINEVAKKYNWINLPDITTDPKVTLAEIKASISSRGVRESLEEIKNNRRRFDILVRNLSKKEAEFLKLVNEFSYIRTDRVDLLKRQMGNMLPFLRYIVSKVEKNVKDVYAINLSNYEIDRILQGDTSAYCKKNLKNLITVYTKGGASFSNNADIAKMILRRLTKSSNIEEIKGFSACKGKARGKVIVYHTGMDVMKNSGFVLVTTHTDPRDVVAMKKSIAIVTDEGGITSHAAIVSRELKKPCIIGTKIATQVLKDGDLVEVDAEKGIVRILKSS